MKRSKTALKRLMKFFGKNQVPDEFVKAWDRVLSEFEDDIIDEMVEWIQMHDRDYRPFPTIQDAWSICDSIKDRKLDREVRRQKAEEFSSAEDFERNARGSMAKGCVRAIFDLLEGKIKKQEFENRLKALKGFDFELYERLSKKRLPATIAVKAFQQGEVVEDSNDGYSYRYAITALEMSDGPRQALEYADIQYIYRRRPFKARDIIYTEEVQDE